MKTLFTAALLSLGVLFSPAALANARSVCEKGAIERKLTGAARDAHMKKCMADGGTAEAAAMCEAEANRLKLTGMQKDSEVRRCMAEALAPNR